MKSKSYLLKLTLLTTLSGLTYNSYAATINQAGTIDSLVEVLTQGSTTLDTMIKYGNYGLGTVNDIPGEMVIYQGKAYLGDSHGKAVPLSNSTKVPFAQSFDFKNPEFTKTLNNVTPKTIDSLIKNNLSGTNYYYAVKITGTFESIKGRSWPKLQKGKLIAPWILKHQTIHNIHSIKGTVIGVVTPSYLSNTSVAGEHFHFIDSTKTQVYHLYDFKSEKVNVTIKRYNKSNIIFPTTESYKLQKITRQDPKVVEKLEKIHKE